MSIRVGVRVAARDGVRVSNWVSVWVHKLLVSHVMKSAKLIKCYLSAAGDRSDRDAGGSSDLLRVHVPEGHQHVTANVGLGGGVVVGGWWWW